MKCNILDEEKLARELEIYKVAGPISGKEKEHFQYLCLRYGSLKMHDECAEYGLKAIEYGAKDYNTYKFLTNSEFYRKNTQSAKVYAKKALSSDPYTVPTYIAYLAKSLMIISCIIKWPKSFILGKHRGYYGRTNSFITQLFKDQAWKEWANTFISDS